MPVDCAIEIDALDQERFHAVDKQVMGHAFAIHNTLGRFCDERIYQEELARRCRKSGLDVLREVLLRVSHMDFAKSYYIDMILERGAAYELKTVEALSGGHQRQLINYLLLAGMHHGKLINLRPASVESRFVSTQLRPSDRAHVIFDDREWVSVDRGSERLRDILSELFVEWGAFLDVNLYREAIVHFMGGQDAVIRLVPIEVVGRVVGSQKMCLLGPDAAWHISALRKHAQSYETHMRRLLKHSPLNRLQWINLDQRKVLLKTLEK